ncbi:MAG: hypothetical protein JWM11_6190 [Planctomycetaceae bacterium]|nr:hypothetical protein [Planctomycetaceae bacterium]
MWASMAWGQSSAPPFAPTLSQQPSAPIGVVPQEPDYLGQVTPPAQVWDTQNPLSVPAAQPATDMPPDFSTAPRNFAAPPDFGVLPSQSWVDTHDDRCCDPVREYIRKILGLNHEPVYLPGYYDPFSTQFAYGSTTVTPYQLGWYNKQEIAYVPTVPTSGAGDRFQFTELNGWMRYAARIDDQHLFTWTLVTNTRLLSGPPGVALGPDVNLVQSDFQLASNDPGPWNWQIGVTPQVDSDFHRQLTSNAYMVDARAVVFNKLSPQLTLAFGAAYWDRNHGNFIPYGGIIWTPDDRWEFRIMSPKSRISYFAGRVGAYDVWLYGSAEYTLDAYQVAIRDETRIKERLELKDYRFMLGINAQRPRFGAYFEGGYITDRHADFRGPSSDFGIGDTWTLRTGVTF